MDSPDDGGVRVSVDQLLSLIGSKEVEIMLLKRQIAAMDEALKKLSPPSEAPQ